jgi:Ion channel
MQAAGFVAIHHFGLAVGVILIVAVFVVSESWAAVAVILVGLALIALATFLRLREPSVIDIYLDAIAWMITALTLGLVVARAVFSFGAVNYHRVIGAVLLYLDIGVIFVALFCFVALLVPNAFNGIAPLQDNFSVATNLIYFSFVTLTTVGYGDIVPVHPFARSLANVEAIIGQLYPATLLARIVTLEIETRRR